MHHSGSSSEHKGDLVSCWGAAMAEKSSSHRWGGLSQDCKSDELNLSSACRLFDVLIR
jgi:hypothetical protein